MTSRFPIKANELLTWIGEVTGLRHGTFFGKWLGLSYNADLKGGVEIVMEWEAEYHVYASFSDAEKAMRENGEPDRLAVTVAVLEPFRHYLTVELVRDDDIMISYDNPPLTVIYPLVDKYVSGVERTLIDAVSSLMWLTGQHYPGDVVDYMIEHDEMFMLKKKRVGSHVVFRVHVRSPLRENLWAATNVYVFVDNGGGLSVDIL